MSQPSPYRKQSSRPPRDPNPARIEDLVDHIHDRMAKTVRRLDAGAGLLGLIAGFGALWASGEQTWFFAKMAYFIAAIATVGIVRHVGRRMVATRVDGWLARDAEIRGLDPTAVIRRFRQSQAQR